MKPLRGGDVRSHNGGRRPYWEFNIVSEQLARGGGNRRALEGGMIPGQVIKDPKKEVIRLKRKNR